MHFGECLLPFEGDGLYHLESVIRNTQPSSQFLPPLDTIQGSDGKESTVANLCRCGISNLEAIGASNRICLLVVKEREGANTAS